MSTRVVHISKVDRKYDALGTLLEPETRSSVRVKVLWDDESISNENILDYAVVIEPDFVGAQVVHAGQLFIIKEHFKQDIWRGESKDGSTGYFSEAYLFFHGGRR